ncbi:Hpt domain-containing protein [Sulfurimonas sp.]
MLIYNFQKEFLGIDEKDLKELGFADLSSLRSEVTDFADLFVKTPGYIHNFKHVHWIDFIDCAEDGEIPKVIINVNNKNFRANISITHAYFTDSPSSKAYLIHLNNLRILSDNEIENIHDDILHKPAPTLQVEKTFVQKEIPKSETLKTEPTIQKFELENKNESYIKEPIIQKIIETNDAPIQDPFDTKDARLNIDIDFNDDKEKIELEEVKHPPINEHLHHTKTIHKKEKFENGYLFDPAIASKELGLPLDLIEEFIQDFIAQANEFKPELLATLADGDIDNVKTLSHKLKGVAANLRIEDAFEVLASINNTSDLAIMQTNLDLFYKIISKLSGEEIDEVIEVEDDEYLETQDMVLDFKDETPATNETPIVAEIENKPEDDNLILDFKDETPTVNETPVVTEIKNISKDIDLALDFKDNDIAVQEIQTDSKIVNKERELNIIEPREQEIKIEYSKSKVANEIGLDIDSFHELFSDYIDETNNLISQMYDAINSDDYTLLHQEALQLKGMSDNMRIDDFTNELKLLIKVNNVEETQRLLETVQKTVNQLSELGV